MRGILSVANRRGLPALAQELRRHDIELFADSKTLKLLKSEGMDAQSIGVLGGSPEMGDSQESLLHPNVVSGVLKPHDEIRELWGDSALIDIVVINIQPLSERIYPPLTSTYEVFSQVEIGEIALLRAAARNFAEVLVLVRPDDYVPVMQEWREQGEVSQETRRYLAMIAFQYTASYDTALVEYLRQVSGEQFPETLTLPLERIQTLRSGENPHQKAAFYRWSSLTSIPSISSVASAEILQGKELSFNNLMDLDVALNVVQRFSAPTVAIIKQTNPCGLACDDQVWDAYKKAHAGDPISAFGGIIGCNRPIDIALAQEVMQLFYEAIIAPEFEPEALELLRGRRDLRLLATHHPIEPQGIITQLLHLCPPDVRSVSGGLLLQTPDIFNERELEYHVVTEREPTLDEVTDLMFAWKVVQYVKSNAIVLAHKLMVVGVGAGQMNRVDSVSLAVEKAGERARGSVLASDAFFPFADGIEATAKAGVTAIIQPGGSLRDEEAIRMANHYAIAMIFTGQRHFRH